MITSKLLTSNVVNEIQTEVKCIPPQKPPECDLLCFLPVYHEYQQYSRHDHCSQAVKSSSEHSQT